MANKMIYSWDSNVLADYSYGKIAVVADSVEEARDLIMRDFKEFILDYRYSVSDKFTAITESDLARFKNDCRQTEADISQEPKISRSIFIIGGG
ncbi:MAG: hypothetical protein ACEQSB_00180 [Undibacterium sp.]